MFGSLAPRCTALNSCDDKLTHLGRIWGWHVSPPKQNQCQ
jgi:hypothetical protein